MTNTPDLRPLSALNENYTPARPWVCVTHEAHDCVGPVIGALGAIPVCVAGAAAEQAARDADRARIAAIMDTPEMRRQIAWEQRMEALHS